MVIVSTRLWYFAGTSDKVYVATVKEQGGLYVVTGQWGRRGKTMQSQTKGTFGDRYRAMMAYQSLVRSKTDKGYRVTERIGS